MDLSLSIIIPAFNGAAWLPQTLRHLRLALATAGWDDAEIIVVDDGSTDDTVRSMGEDHGSPPVRIISQVNAGRFAARQTGLHAARGALVMFCDVRVFVHSQALQFVRGQLIEHPESVVWNGHAVTAPDSGLVSSFWDAITFLAWRRYLRNPETTSYGVDDFEYYPKGTTLFLAPRLWLIEACEQFDTRVGDLSKANDDTLLIRPLAMRSRINISPSFSCTYHPRTTLREFAQHSFHRGAVFVDGHLRPGSRYLIPYIACLVATPFGFVCAVRRPRLTSVTAIAASGGIGLAATAAGAPKRASVALAALAPAFAATYGAGTLYGLWLRLKHRMR
ncbi:MAG TPA: glycosyltransferase family A protein [Acidimicrobiales bacterium]|nr:glycosyltransferase family A protein [Acidimicrobiales bacterium]